MIWWWSEPSRRNLCEQQKGPEQAWCAEASWTCLFMNKCSEHIKHRHSKLRTYVQWNKLAHTGPSVCEFPVFGLSFLHWRPDEGWMHCSCSLTPYSLLRCDFEMLKYSAAAAAEETSGLKYNVNNIINMYAMQRLSVRVNSPARKKVTYLFVKRILWRHSHFYEAWNNKKWKATAGFLDTQ